MGLHLHAVSLFHLPWSQGIQSVGHLDLHPLIEFPRLLGGCKHWDSTCYLQPTIEVHEGLQLSQHENHDASWKLFFSNDDDI